MSNYCDEFLREIDKQLDLPLDKRVQVMRELVSHYREIRDELLEEGMELAQADREAVGRMGRASDIAGRLNAAHNSASWKSAWLAAAPFIGWAMCLLVPANRARVVLGALLGLFLLAGSIRELVIGKRPAWLATWFGCCLGGISYAATRIWPNSPAMPTVVILAVMLAITLIIATWPSPAWRWKGIGFGLSYAVLSAVTWLATGSDVLRPFAGFFMIAHIICFFGSVQVLSARIFADHRYGSVSQASLCLFALFAAAGLWTELRLDPWVLAGSFIFAGLAAMLFARAARWPEKVAILALGLLAKYALFDAFTNLPRDDNYVVSFDPTRYLIGLLIMWAIIILAVLAPMLGERSVRGSRPAIAR